jgi:hypothetical protein
MVEGQDDFNDEDWQELNQYLKDAGLDVQFVDGGDGGDEGAEDYADDTLRDIFEHSESGNFQELDKILSGASRQIDLNASGGDICCERKAYIFTRWFSHVGKEFVIKTEHPHGLVED